MEENKNEGNEERIRGVKGRTDAREEEKWDENNKKN